MNWLPPSQPFLKAIAKALASYKGPVALMSFDPAVMAALKSLAPSVPRGIVSGAYYESWWPEALDVERRYRLTHLIESGPVAPDFFAYHCGSLPTPVTRFLREGLGLPLFTWTVRSPEDLAVARAWADAPIFEAIDPLG